MDVLVLGAGRSSWYLLDYLNRTALSEGWSVLACDMDIAALQKRTGGMQAVTGMQLDVENSTALEEQIKQSRVVVSLLPPSMHSRVATLCLTCNVHLATASYVSTEMQALHTGAKEKGLVFLNELGLDPGIDHLSAMQILNDLRAGGCEILSFESYCGGLVHPDDEGDNPWKYKFSWNPRNVVLAGQGGMAMFRKDGQIRYVPPHRLFAVAETMQIPGIGSFDAYANRDSLGYEQMYGLEQASTIVRGTLRRAGFCSAWQVLVALGFTDAVSPLAHGISSAAELVRCLTGLKQGGKLSDWLLHAGIINPGQARYFDFLNLENQNEKVENAVYAADILQHSLLKSWALRSSDRDEVVMYHRVKGVKGDRPFEVHSTFRLAGKDSEHTAMAATVGIPLAMGVVRILRNEVMGKGVVVPVASEWYESLLPRLKEEGIFFTETREF
ncbi:MAG: saccharopine dehydrogenase NADP-binding domain-containing protein [Bacteroidetes bacterium]|nr:saccharopine dehydrogenase NADP-binding domain-containing protein [Bacteroidota bacterium]